MNEKMLSAVCGLFCPSCTLYIGTKEEPERLAALAAKFGVPAEEMKCDGCRSNRRSVYCKSCEFIACAEKKGIDFCGQCGEYPCEKLSSFKEQMPHRLELWDYHKRIGQVGCEKWFAEMEKHYSCPQCGAMNSAYDPVCRKCGHNPGSEFAACHKEEVLKVLKKNQ